MTTIRADLITHTANVAKVRRQLELARPDRDTCAAIAASKWRTFWESGKFGGTYANCARFNDFCGAAPGQTARAQVAPMLASVISNPANDFADAVQRSSEPADATHQVHMINRRTAWHSKTAVLCKGVEIPVDLWRAALTIFRSIRTRHSLPNADGIAPILDTRAVTVAPSHTKHAGL